MNEKRLRISVFKEIKIMRKQVYIIIFNLCVCNLLVNKSFNLVASG